MHKGEHWARSKKIVLPALGSKPKKTMVVFRAHSMRRSWWRLYFVRVMCTHWMTSNFPQHLIMPMIISFRSSIWMFDSLKLTNSRFPLQNGIENDAFLGFNASHYALVSWFRAEMARGCYSLKCLNWTPIFGWCVDRWGSKNEHHKDAYLKESQLRLHIRRITPHSIMYIIEMTYVFKLKN